MNTRAKETVKSFYETDPIISLDTFLDFLHPQVTLDWHSSFGFRTLDYKGIQETFSNMKKSFNSLESEIKDIISEADKVMVRYTYIGKTIERPDKEDQMGYFMVVWELKEGKLYKGYQISQQSDDA